MTTKAPSSWKDCKTNDDMLWKQCWQEILNSRKRIKSGLFYYIWCFTDKKNPSDFLNSDISTKKPWLKFKIAELVKSRTSVTCHYVLTCWLSSTSSVIQSWNESIVECWRVCKIVVVCHLRRKEVMIACCWMSVDSGEDYVTNRNGAKVEPWERPKKSGDWSYEMWLTTTSWSCKKPLKKLQLK